MANIHSSITELVGHTPLVEFVNYEKKLGLRTPTSLVSWSISIHQEA